MSELMNTFLIETFRIWTGDQFFEFKGGGVAKIRSTRNARLHKTTPWVWYSSFICFFLGFRTRASRSPSPQITEIAIFPISSEKIKKKLKCKGSANDFLAMLDPPYKGQSTGNHLYFPMVPFFFREKLPKSAKKVILLKNCLKWTDF